MKKVNGKGKKKAKATKITKERVSTKQKFHVKLFDTLQEKKRAILFGIIIGVGISIGISLTAQIGERNMVERAKAELGKRYVQRQGTPPN